MLAIWEYFWDWDTVAAPAATPVPVTPGRGSGHSHDDYLTLPDEYWEARAKQTAPHKVSPEVLEERKTRLREEVRQILAEQQQVTLLRQDYTAVLAALKNATTIADMKTLAAQSKILQEQLAELEATNKARIIRAQLLRASLEN